MKASKFLLVGLWGLLGFTTSANAALLGNVCTFAGGCGPDFAVLGADANYAYNGSSGTLTITGLTGNASFLPGQLEPWPDATEAIGILAGKDPDISIPVSNATVLDNRNFSLNMTVDGTGNLLGGSITMNGKVAQVFSTATTTNSAFPGGFYTATSANGTLLDGALISGSAITSMGFNTSTIDFWATLDPASVLSVAGFGSIGAGIIGLTNISSGLGDIDWSTNWTATATVDVVVPLPAALWLFLSGIAVLFSASKSKIMNVCS